MLYMLNLKLYINMQYVLHDIQNQMQIKHNNM
jgi:hypothetical protein